MTSSIRKYHLGLGFDLWTNRGAWFWRLAGGCPGFGTIGAALTEDEALRQAHLAVEEISARCAHASTLNLDPSKSMVPQPGLQAKLDANVENSTTKVESERGEC
jgi:hypothetical protein